jgi:bifunctional non-homologous end joining protein LigD
MPDDVDSVETSQDGSEEPYVVIHNLQGLISLVQMNVLEFHPWGARVDHIERPDRLVFDLDPGPGVSWEMMQECAIEVRDFLDNAGLTSFVRTSGGAGLHVVAPIARRSTWEEAGDFAHQVALRLVERSPQKYVANMRKALRKDRIFIDYVRNRRSATAIASYSTRAREGAPVATPLDWPELSQIASASQFNIFNVVERLKPTRKAAWKDFFTVRQSLTRAAWKELRK